MRVCIFDDEAAQCENLSNMVEDFFDELHRDVFYEISAFASEADFLKFFSERGADVCFLDISTPANEDAGLEAAKKMRAADQAGRAHVVFVTSRADKLSKSLELFIRPTDYLLKPVSRAQVYRVLSHILEQERSSALRVALRFGKNVYFADYSDIYTIEKVGRKTVLSLKSRTIEVNNTIRELLDGAPDYFIQIDKGTIVNMNAVSEIGFATKMLTLCNGSTVFMSRSSRSKVRDALQNGEGGAQMSSASGARATAGNARAATGDARRAAGGDLPSGW